MSRRVLVLSASVGSGHLRAAQAVELAVRQLDPTAVVENFDVLDFTNADFLLENGAAVKINNFATLSYKLSRLLADPTHLALLQKNARRLGKPRAALDVARAALSWPTAANDSNPVGGAQPP